MGVLKSELIGNIVFSKEFFIETINKMEEQQRYDLKCSEAFSVILSDDYVTGYQNHWLRNQLIKILQKAMNDDVKHSWIDYYIYELDFGLKYTKGCVKIYGKDFELKTASDLWELLNYKTLNK